MKSEFFLLRGGSFVPLLTYRGLPCVGRKVFFPSPIVVPIHNNMLDSKHWVWTLGLSFSITKDILGACYIAPSTSIPNVSDKPWCSWILIFSRDEGFNLLSHCGLYHALDWVCKSMWVACKVLSCFEHICMSIKLCTNS